MPKDNTQPSLSSYLNKACTSNVHFKNISSLLLDFHGYSNTVFLETNPPFYLIPCCQKTELPSPKQACSRFILSHYKITKNPTCSSCSESNKCSQKKVKRKERNEHDWIKPESKCNWRYLTSESCSKQRKNIVYKLCKLKNTLKMVIEKQEQISLNPQNHVKGQIINKMSKAGNVPKSIYHKFRNDLIKELMSKSEE